MRFLIDTKTDKMTDYLRKASQEKKAEIEIISSYEPIERLSGQVEKLGNALREFKASGINWTVFVYYLKGKGISSTQLRRVMGKVEDFFKEVGLPI